VACCENLQRKYTKQELIEKGDQMQKKNGGDLLPLIMPRIKVGGQNTVGAKIPQSMTVIAYALKSCLCLFSLHTFVRVKNNMHLFFTNS